MGLNKKSVDDINVNGKRVLVRCDFNVPLKEGKITAEEYDAYYYSENFHFRLYL